MFCYDWQLGGVVIRPRLSSLCVVLILHMYPLVKLRYSEEVTQVGILYAREAERQVISRFEVLSPSVALVLFDSFTTSALILLRALARRFSYIAMNDQ